jgi:hypothetical protein
MIRMLCLQGYPPAIPAASGSSNATLQAPPIAGARYERKLLAVACKRSVGRAQATQ